VIRVIDIETWVVKIGDTVEGFVETRVPLSFKTCVATCFKAGIATQCFDAGVGSHCFETDVPDQCLLIAAVTAQSILTADGAFAVTSLHDE